MCGLLLCPSNTFRSFPFKKLVFGSHQEKSNSQSWLWKIRFVQALQFQKFIRSSFNVRDIAFSITMRIWIRHRMGSVRGLKILICAGMIKSSFLVQKLLKYMVLFFVGAISFPLKKLISKSRRKTKVSWFTVLVCALWIFRFVWD